MKQLYTYHETAKMKAQRLCGYYPSALINIAHPSVRESLEKAAREIWRLK